MQITRNSLDTVVGPEDWFTGVVHIDAVAAPSAGSRLSASCVHFTPGARTAWHTHPLGQTLLIVSGTGRVQAWGGPVRQVRAGDVVWFAPGEKHWHGASPANAMVHVAMQEAKDGSYVDWLEHVSDEQFARAPEA